MTQDQYYLLVQFPKNRTYLSDKQLERNLDKLGFKGDYDYLTEKYNELYFLGYVEGLIPEPGLKITQKGIDALQDYRREIKATQKGFWTKLYDSKPVFFWLTIIGIIATLVGSIIAVIVWIEQPK